MTNTYRAQRNPGITSSKKMLRDDIIVTPSFFIKFEEEDLKAFESPVIEALSNYEFQIEN